MKAKKNNYHISTLSNGLRVLSYPMPSRKSVTLGIWSACGGRYEKMEKAGISHFIEHMVFKGTKKYSSMELKKAIEGVGGYLNAFTSEEFTCYYSKVAASYLNQAIDVLSDMVIAPTFRESDFKREKSVILEEIKLYFDLPSHHAVEILYKLLWPNQSLGMFLAGTHKTVGDITCADLRKFKELYYTSPNICVIACGDVSHKLVLEQVEKSFKNFKSGSKNSFPPAVRTQDNAKLKVIEKKLEQTHLAIGFHASGRHSENRFAEGLLNIMLGGNMSSRLFQEVRENKGLAYEIGSHIRRYDDTGALIINAGIHNDKKEQALKVIFTELKKIADKKAAEEELKRAKEFFRGQFMLALEDTAERMIWLGESLITLDKIESEQDIMKKLDAITTADIKEAGKRLFSADGINLSIVGPVKKEEEKKIEKSLKI
ncbi:MAG: pitrilysin family protein [Candidatus Omnitrophota bacterium]